MTSYKKPLSPRSDKRRRVRTDWFARTINCAGDKDRFHSKQRDEENIEGHSSQEITISHSQEEDGTDLLGWTCEEGVIFCTPPSESERESSNNESEDDGSGNDGQGCEIDNNKLTYDDDDDDGLEFEVDNTKLTKHYDDGRDNEGVVTRKEEGD